MGKYETEMCPYMGVTAAQSRHWDQFFVVI